MWVLIDLFYKSNSKQNIYYEKYHPHLIPKGAGAVQYGIG